MKGKKFLLLTNTYSADHFGWESIHIHHCDTDVTVDYWVHPQFLVVFVLITCWFSVCWIVDRCLSFFYWPLCCLFFFDLWILITPLASSNSSYLNYYLMQQTCLFLWTLSLTKNTVNQPNVTNCTCTRYSEFQLPY